MGRVEVAAVAHGGVSPLAPPVTRRALPLAVHAPGADVRGVALACPRANEHGEGVGSFGAPVQGGFPVEFTLDGEPCSGIAARAALVWSVGACPGLLRAHARAVEGPDDAPEGADLDAREALAAALAGEARSFLLRAAADAGEVCTLAAVAHPTDPTGAGVAGSFAASVAAAERALYLSRWLAAACTWERRETAAHDRGADLDAAAQ